MRTLIALALISAAPVTWAAEVQSDTTTTQTREVGAFSAVRLEISAEVVVTVGGPVRVVVTTEEGQQQHVRTDVRGGALVIERKRGAPTGAAVRVEVSVPELRKVEVDGSGRVRVEGGRGDTELELEGSGEIRWAGEAAELEVEIEGSGDVALAGKATKLDVEVRGSGDVNASALAARDVSVEIEGSGDVAVHVDGGTLRAEVSGSGDVIWSGSANVERAVVSGSGEIRRVQ